MKKGLIRTAVGTIILAIAGGGFANAPTISNVPDVIISDAEDNLGTTIDLNFFRYNNALNLMSYINDSDSTAQGDLNFAFTEDEGADVQAIDINGVTEISDPNTLPWPSGEYINNALTGSFMLSFRNIKYSPRGRLEGDPTPDNNPFPNPIPGMGITEEVQLDEREVTLFVSDQDDNITATPEVITVFTKNAGQDDLSPSFTTIFSDSTFQPYSTTEPNGWAFTRFNFGFAFATSSVGDGSGAMEYLGVTTGLRTTGQPVGKTAFFSRWYNPGSGAGGLFTAPIPVVEGSLIYQAKIRLNVIAANNSSQAFAPDIRYGAENTAQTLSIFNLINSQGMSTPNPADLPGAPTEAQRNPQLPAVGAYQDYSVYWSPNTAAPDQNLAQIDVGGGTIVDFRRWRIFFDVYDWDVAGADNLQDSGTYQISNVEVGILPRPGDLPVGDPNRFLLTDLFTGFAAPTAYPITAGSSVVGNAGGSITFNMALGNGSVVPKAQWQKFAVRDWVAGKIYRVTASLSCPSEAARGNFRTFRLRNQLEPLWFAQVFTVNKIGASQTAYMPGTTPTPYETYVPSYGGPNAWIQSLEGLWYSASANDPTKFSLGLDHIGMTTTDAAVQWTVHSVLYEAFDDPRP